MPHYDLVAVEAPLVQAVCLDLQDLVTVIGVQVGGNAMHEYNVSCREEHLAACPISDELDASLRTVRACSLRPCWLELAEIHREFPGSVGLLIRHLVFWARDGARASVRVQSSLDVRLPEVRGVKQNTTTFQRVHSPSSAT